MLQKLNEEMLLRPEVRAQLSLAYQLILYFDPFLLFKDVSHGKLVERERALEYNRDHSWMLFRYITRWTVIGTALLATLVYSEAALKAWTLLLAGIGIGTCVSFTVVFFLIGCYILLKSRA